MPRRAGGARPQLIEIPYSPRYPGVHETLEAVRFTVLVAHRRFGKTVLAVNHLLKSALTCRLGRGSFAYVGPFRNQAKAVAWAYLKHYSAPVPGRQVNEGELRIDLPNGAFVRIFGADNPDALRGLYFDGVVLDEVAQMKSEVWEEIIQPALADRMGRALFIGTPKGINLFSELYFAAAERQAKGSADWAALCFPVTETEALDGDEVERLRSELSENAFRQEMLCDFSATGDNVLISIDEARAAMSRREEPESAAAWPLVIGVDVARFGEDATVFFGRRGRQAYEPLVLRRLSNVEVAHRLMAHIAERRPKFVCIDQGQGTGVIDLVRELASGLDTTIVEVPFGSRALDAERFANRRAEMWTLTRDWLRGGGCLPESQALLGELTAPQYSFDAQGRIRLEPKEDIRERLRRSTDIADALALTFAVPAAPEDGAFMPWLEERYGREGASGARRWALGRDRGLTEKERYERLFG